MESNRGAGRHAGRWTGGVFAAAAALLASAGVARAAGCPTGSGGPGQGVVLSVQETRRPAGAGTNEVAVFALG